MGERLLQLDFSVMDELDPPILRARERIEDFVFKNECAKHLADVCQRVIARRGRYRAGRDEPRQGHGRIQAWALLIVKVQ